jgi:hypothetical protein
MSVAMLKEKGLEKGMHHLKCNTQVPPRRTGNDEDAHCIRRGDFGKWCLIQHYPLHETAWGSKSGGNLVANPIRLVGNLPLVDRTTEKRTESKGHCSRFAAGDSW